MMVKDVYSLVVLSPRGSTYTTVEDIANDAKSGRVHVALSHDDEEGISSAWLLIVRALDLSGGVATFGDIDASWFDTGFLNREEAEANAQAWRLKYAASALGYWPLVTRGGFKDRVFGKWAEEDTRRLYRTLYSVKEPELLRDVEEGVNGWRGAPSSVSKEELAWMITKIPILNLVELKEVTFR
jgi:hypothetical protein